MARPLRRPAAALAAALLPLLLVVAPARPAAAAVEARILLVGDSWAALMWKNRTLKRLFAMAGIPEVEDAGATTAIGGTTAAFWNSAAGRDLITRALAADPKIAAVHLIMGGNDFLAGKAAGGWFGGMSAAQQKAFFDRVKAHIRGVVDHVRKARPGILVVIGGYDYINLVETVLRAPLGACALTWWNLGMPTAAQVNAGLVALERVKRDIAAALPGVHYVDSLGANQWFHGYPSLGIAPQALPLPGKAPAYTPFAGGNSALPTPPEALGAGGSDCIHLSDTGYLVVGWKAMLDVYLPAVAGTL